MDICSLLLNARHFPDSLASHRSDDALRTAVQGQDVWDSAGNMVSTGHRLVANPDAFSW